MSGPESSLRRRVEALSADARGALAERLRTRAGSVGPGPLVAWVVPRDAAAQLDADALRAFLQQRLPDALVPSAIVRIDALPRTPTGKVDVNALPAPPAPGTGSGGDPFTTPRDPVERILAGIWSELLGGVRVGLHDNFFEIGGDSILSIQAVARAARAGVRITAEDLFRHQTIAGLAHTAGTTALTDRAEQGVVVGEVPLTPIQHWFRAQRLARPGHWHHVMWLDAPADFDAAAFRAALDRVMLHHDALRLRFRLDDAAQWHGPASEQAVVRHADLTAVGTVDLGGALQAAADALAAATDLTDAPPVAALIAERHGTPFRIGLVIHHLVIDPLSWGILLEDLDAAYGALVTGREVVLPAKTMSFRAWAEALVAHAGEASVRAGADRWAAVMACVADVPRDRAGAFTEATAHTHVVALDAARTRALLDELPATRGAHTDEVLLAALLPALAAWTERRALRIGVERHGREPVAGGADLSRTVGWFTSYFPVALTLPEGPGPADTLDLVREQLRGLPDRGIGYGLLRYLCADTTVRARVEGGEPDVIFNFGGRAAAEAGPARRLRSRGMPAPSRAPENHRAHVLEVGAVVAGDRLEMHWTYSRAVHHDATIARLAGNCLAELERLIDQRASRTAGGLTPTDFPEAGLSQAELDRLLGELGP